MSSQGIMSSKQANNSIGLCPIKGQWSGPCSQVRARYQFSSLSLCTTRTTPCHGNTCICSRIFFSPSSSIFLVSWRIHSEDAALHRNFQNIATDGETSLKSVSIWRLVFCLLSILSIKKSQIILSNKLLQDWLTPQLLADIKNRIN